MIPQLIEFDWCHLAKLQFREYDRMGFDAFGNSRQQLQTYLDSGIVYSGVIDNKVIMIGGVCLTRPRVGFAWVLTSNLVKEFKKFFHKACLEVIDKGVALYGLHRVETTIAEGHQVSIDWALRIGFDHECLMKKYDSEGNNYHLFSRIL